MRKVIAMCVVALLSLTLVHCKTTEETNVVDPNAPPPEIYSNMPLEKALDAAINYGGTTADQVRKLVTKRQEWKKATVMLGLALKDNALTYQNSQLINATMMYQSSPQPAMYDVFEALLATSRPMAHQLAWQIAASKPSGAIAQAIDRVLTKAVHENEEEAMLVPQLGDALVANQVKSGYSWARQGLFSNGSDQFAKAMINLDPSKASSDFLDYLALAPAEELRQLTLKNVNVYSVMVILNHLTKTPAPVAHQNIDQLFTYSVSRNTAIAALAASALEQYLANNRDIMAVRLNQLPIWAQIAFVENAKRRTSPSTELFLTEMKKVASSTEVVDEINESAQ